MDIVLPIPPLAEQHRIVNKVDELIAVCDTLTARLNEAQAIKIQLADAIVERAVS
jgi:type I restriction enzyme S subunit